MRPLKEEGEMVFKVECGPLREEEGETISSVACGPLKEEEEGDWRLR